jgi:hypothetical protein
VPTTVAAPVTTTAAPTTTVAAGDGPAAVGPEECQVVSAPVLEKVFGGPPPAPAVVVGRSPVDRVCDWKSQEKHVAMRIERTFSTAFAGFKHDKGVVELTGLDKPALVQTGTDRPELTVMVKVSDAAAIEVTLFRSPPDQDLARQVAADVLLRWEKLPRQVYTPSR